MYKFGQARSGERGLGLIEALVSLAIVALVSSAVISNLKVALRTSKFTELNHAASSIAASRIEELAAIPVEVLDSGYNEVEAPINWADFNIGFLRSTTVTAQADGSKNVRVRVSSDSEIIRTTVNFESTFADWE